MKLDIKHFSDIMELDYVFAIVPIKLFENSILIFSCKLP